MEYNYPFWKKALLVILGAALAAGSVFILSAARGSTIVMVETEALERYRGVFEIDSILHRLYYSELDDEALQAGAYRGLVNAVGDQYTSYYTPEEYESYSKQRGSSYKGIGISYYKLDGEPAAVTSVTPDSPAARAGIAAGDLVMAVDGKEAAALSTAEFSGLFLGGEGPFELTMLTGDRQWTCSVVPEEIENRTAHYTVLDGGAGYIDLDGFNGNCVSVFEEALPELEAGGAPGLIIDLRDNPGGYVDVCEDLCDMLLDEAEVYYTIDGSGHRETHSSEDGMLYTGPVIVLVNENSASSSEMFTGALQDNGRATVMGVQTYGKGVVQSIAEMSDGGAVKVTSSAYYTPLGRSIQAQGLTPDVIMDDDDGDDVDDVLEAAKARLK